MRRIATKKIDTKTLECSKFRLALSRLTSDMTAAIGKENQFYHLPGAKVHEDSILIEPS